MTRVEVSRFFEPVPEFRVEARYTFTWTGGELDSIRLSQRKDKGDGRMNSQFAEVEDLDLGDVPDGVVADARAELEEYASQLTKSGDAGGDDSGSGGSEAEGRELIPLARVQAFYQTGDVDPLRTVATGDWPEFDGSEWPSQTFLVSRVSQLLESLAVNDDGTALTGPVRVSLPEFETRDDADEGAGSVLAIEGAGDRVGVLCPWLGDFEDDADDDGDHDGGGEGEGVDDR